MNGAPLYLLYCVSLVFSLPSVDEWLNVRGWPPRFIAQVGRFGWDKLENHHKPPLGALMTPLAKGGPEWCQWRWGTWLGRLGTAFTRSVTWWAWIVATLVFYPNLMIGWAFFAFLGIKSALRFVWRRTLITFYMYSMFMPYKWSTHQNSQNLLV
jgi:hypothetical protein